MDRPEPAGSGGTVSSGLLDHAGITGWSTADLFDQYEPSVDVCDTTFLRFGRRRAFSGICETVLTHEDFRVVEEVFTKPGDGRVLVVDARGARFTSAARPSGAGAGSTQMRIRC